ncbi:hypothetical protein Tco_1521026, partial [Tanacetum coccineum]
GKGIELLMLKEFGLKPLLLGFSIPATAGAATSWSVVAAMACVSYASICNLFSNVDDLVNFAECGRLAERKVARHQQLHMATLASMLTICQLCGKWKDGRERELLASATSTGETTSLCGAFHLVGIMRKVEGWYRATMNVIGDDDNFWCSMRALLRPVSWLGIHTKHVTAAMSSLWCRYYVHISKPHLRSLMILSIHPYFLCFFLKCRTAGQLRLAHKRGDDDNVVFTVHSLPMTVTTPADAIHLS